MLAINLIEYVASAFLYSKLTYYPSLASNQLIFHPLQQKPTPLKNLPFGVATLHNIFPVALTIADASPALLFGPDLRQ